MLSIPRSRTWSDILVAEADAPLNIV